MQPIGKYILIHPVNEEMETQSGLLLTSDDVGELRYRKATVVASGTEVTAISSDDTIYYDSRAGHSMMIKDIQYSVIRESDVVVVE